MPGRRTALVYTLVSALAAVAAEPPAAPDEPTLVEVVARAQVIVLGTWIAAPASDRIRVLETLEGRLPGAEPACQSGGRLPPATESILLLRVTASAACELIAWVGASQRAQVVYINGQTRFARGDYAGAARAWKSVLDDGPLDAYNNLGWLLYNGMGIRADRARAIQLWLHAAERGAPEAQVHLADAYLEGSAIRRDVSEALSWAMCAVQFAGRIADQDVAESIYAQAQRTVQRIRGLASPAERKEGERRAAALKAQRVDAYWSRRLR